MRFLYNWILLGFFHFLVFFSDYVVTVTSQSLSGTYEIESDINFVRVPKPSTQYSVTVQAVNGAGNSMEQGATLMATTEGKQNIPL